MRRVLGDTLMSALALTILLIALVSIDERVRERVSGVIGGRTTTTELAGVRSQVGQTATILFKAAKDQTIEHAPLVIFVVAGSVLVLAMLRL